MERKGALLGVSGSRGEGPENWREQGELPKISREQGDYKITLGSREHLFFPFKIKRNRDYMNLDKQKVHEV